MRRFGLTIVFAIAMLFAYFSGNNVCGEVVPTPKLLPNISPEMLNASFWIDNTADTGTIVLNREEISRFNQMTKLRLPNTVYDLRQYPATIDAIQLQAMVEENKIPSEQRFVNGNVLSSKYWNALLEEANLKNIGSGLKTVTFGFTVKRANLRTFPTDDFVTSSPSDRDFDLFQETALEGAEPVIVLHKSASGGWLFVQTSNYRGWLDAALVVLAKERSLWQRYVDAKDFLVVTNSSLAIGKNTFGMGAKIALAQEQTSPAGTVLVSIPAKNSSGDLYFDVLPVNLKDGVSKGYLPYTRANVIKQAFKMLGEPYDWGGRKNWRDCSSFIQDIYRVFGIALPRNADEQEHCAGKTFKFTGDLKARLNTIKNLKPGATLHMDGHVMLYLGEYNQKHYAIHALSGYSDTMGRRFLVREVVVSDLSLRTRSGYSYLEVLTVGKNMEF